MLDLYGADNSDLDYLPPSLPLSQAVRRRKKDGLPELGDNSVLPQARNAAASVPVNPVEQARVLPAATNAARPFAALTSNYDTRINDYQTQLDALNKDPDYSGMAEQVRNRGHQGVEMLGASLAAGMGPRDMHAMQQGLATQSAHLMQPQKIEGGEIDAAGNVSIDPGFKRQKQIESMRSAMQHLEQQKLAAVTAEERYRIEEQQNKMMNQFHMMMAQNARDAAADRAANARALIDLRRDTLDAKGGPLNLKDAAQIEDRMSDDFRSQTKNYVTELDAARKILTVPTDRKWSPIEQQSAIVMLNKILDPGSVVREGEFDRVAQAQGVFQRAGLALEKLKTGATLSPALQQDIREVADFYNKASTARMNMIAQDYSNRAKRRGLDARNVVGIYAQPDPTEPGGAPVMSNDPAAVNARKHNYYPNANANR